MIWRRKEDIEFVCLCRDMCVLSARRFFSPLLFQPFVIARNQYWINCLASSPLLFSFFFSHGLPCLGVCLALGSPLPLGLSFACALAFSCVTVCAFAFAYASLCFCFVLEVNTCLDLSFNFYMQLFNNIAACHKE
jgi:hypothetical protein